VIPTAAGIRRPTRADPTSWIYCRYIWDDSSSAKKPNKNVVKDGEKPACYDFLSASSKEDLFQLNETHI